jgi:hypothetical protein
MGLLFEVMRSMFLSGGFLSKGDRFGRGASVVCGVKCDRLSDDGIVVGGNAIDVFERGIFYQGRSRWGIRKSDRC